VRKMTPRGERRAMRTPGEPGGAKGGMPPLERRAIISSAEGTRRPTSLPATSLSRGCEVDREVAQESADQVAEKISVSRQESRQGRENLMQAVVIILHSTWLFFFH